MPSTAHNIPSARTSSREPVFQAAAHEENMTSQTSLPMMTSLSQESLLSEDMLREHTKRVQKVSREEFEHLKRIMASVLERLHNLDHRGVDNVSFRTHPGLDMPTQPASMPPRRVTIAEDDADGVDAENDATDDPSFRMLKQDHDVDSDEDEEALPVQRQSTRSQVQTLWEEYASEEHIPETLFAYSMTMLAEGRIGVAQAMAYVMLQFSIQIELICLLLVGVSVKLMQFNYNDHPSRSGCMPYVFYDKSAENMLAAMITIFLSGLTLQNDDMEHILTFYPHGSVSRGVHLLVRIARFFQCLFIPCFTLYALPMCLLGCGTAFDVVMNGFAFTFIADLDGLMYHSILTAEQRTDYKVTAAAMVDGSTATAAMSYARMETKRRTFVMWCFCIANVGVMIGNYFMILSYSQFHGDAYVSAFLDNTYMSNGDTFYHTFYFISQLSLVVRPAIQVLLGELPEESSDELSSSCCQRMLYGAARFGEIVWYGVVIMLLCFLLPVLHGALIQMDKLKTCTYD